MNRNDDLITRVAGCFVVIFLIFSVKSCVQHTVEEDTARAAACDTDRCRCMAYADGNTIAVLACR